jgi:uncharacterized protein YndB with AHSA1/START domain
MAEGAQQLTLVRNFAAPIDKVWQAWTTPEGWTQWYGKPWETPKDSVSMDLRVGGRWKSTTIAQGNTINFGGEFKELDAPSKLVMTFDSPSEPGITGVETVTVFFKPLGENKTEMIFTQSGNLPLEEYLTGLKEGWSGFFDALERHLTGN